MPSFGKDVIEQYKKGSNLRASPLNRFGYISLGKVEDFAEFPASSKISTTDNNLSFDDSLFNLHAFILGSTGSGKTETILRIVSEVLENTDRNLYVIDGKGDLDTAEKIATLAYQSGRGQTPIFSIGQEERGASYDALRGDPHAVYNKLAELVGVREAEGNARHFAERKKRLLQLVCGIGQEESEILAFRGYKCPRSLQEVADRVTITWLEETYASTRVGDSIKLLKKGGDIEDLHLKIENLNASFGDVVNPNGFALEDTKAAVFSLRTMSAGIDAPDFLNFFMSDLKDWIGKRQIKGQKGLIIIDEFGTFRNETIIEVLALARSYELGVILATQDVWDLGDERVRRRILTLTNTKILMKTDYPEEVAALAGTLQGFEANLQFGKNSREGGKLVRSLKIETEDVTALTPGQAYIINSGNSAKIQVVKVEDIVIDPNAIAPVSVEEEVDIL